MQIAAVLFIIGAVGSAIPFSVYDLTFWRVVGVLAIIVALFRRRHTIQVDELNALKD